MIRKADIYAVIMVLVALIGAYLSWNGIYTPLNTLIILISILIITLYGFIRFSDYFIRPGFSIKGFTRILGLIFLLLITTGLYQNEFSSNLIYVIIAIGAFAIIFSLIYADKPLKIGKPPEYNHETAIFLAKISDEVYKDAEEFDVEHYTKELVEHTNTPFDTQAYVITHDSEPKIIIAFRGTENNWKDWVTDCNILSSGYTHKSGIKGWMITLFLPKRVHSGFLNAYQVIRADLHPIVYKFLTKYPDLTEIEFLVTGHSLGGALATLCALEMQEMYPDLFVKMYNFGSPRVGNRRFVEHYMNHVRVSWRIVNKKDMVPSIPPRFSFLKLLIGYNHIPHFRYIETNGEFDPKPEFEEIHPPALSFVEGALEVAFSNQEPMNDHLSSNYYKSLKNMKFKESE